MVLEQVIWAYRKQLIEPPLHCQSAPRRCTYGNACSIPVPGMQWLGRAWRRIVLLVLLVNHSDTCR